MFNKDNETYNKLIGNFGMDKIYKRFGYSTILHFNDLCIITGKTPKMCTMTWNYVFTYDI